MRAPDYVLALKANQGSLREDVELSRELDRLELLLEQRRSGL